MAFIGRLLTILSVAAVLVAVIGGIFINYLSSHSEYRKSIFASILNTIVDPNNEPIMKERCGLLSQATGSVLEIGSGTGINLHCYSTNSKITSLTVIEPNPYMREYFTNNTKKLNIKFTINYLGDDSSISLDTVYESLKDSSFDSAVITHVLCSIPDPGPRTLLYQIYRLLKPQKKLLLLEHIEADFEKNPIIFGIQQFLAPIWIIISDGCEFKPIEHYLIEMKSIYSNIKQSIITLPLPLPWVREHVKAILTK